MTKGQRTNTDLQNTKDHFTNYTNQDFYVQNEMLTCVHFPSEIQNVGGFEYPNLFGGRT